MTPKQIRTLKFKEKNPLYSVWFDMHRRCKDPRDNAYKNYGERGISVTPEWETYKQFEKDMGPRPSPKHSLDRIDNDLGYFPANCRWATKKEQQRNRRGALKATFDGKEYLLVALAEEHGIKPAIVYARVRRGLPFEKVISQTKLYVPFPPGMWKRSVASRAKKTHCPQGHPYDSKSKEGWRKCSICHRDRERIRRASKAS